jgi:FMN phosphatase YigB (HAD superfamily)
MNTEREKVIIFDIDGTLANVDHRRHLVEGKKKDFNAFYDAMIDDTVFEHVRGMCNMLYSNKWQIFICTGRPEAYREITEQWLKSYGIFYHHLMMRPNEHKFVSDVKIKKVMLDDIQEHFDVHCCFDDRNQVVEMWRENGVPCFQVAAGNF